MTKKHWAAVLAISSVTACAEPLETMQPADRLKSTSGASEAEVVILEAEPEIAYISAEEADADIIIELVATGPQGTGSLRLPIPMKRAVVRGYGPLLPQVNLIGDRFDEHGQFTGAMHLSASVLELTCGAARVAVDVWWTDPVVGEGKCQGELSVTIGRIERDTLKGGCVLKAKYRRPTARSNYRLKPTDPRVTPLAEERKRRATRPAA